MGPVRLHHNAAQDKHRSGKVVVHTSCNLATMSMSRKSATSGAVQALNNWGLVLQELSTMRTPTERVLLVQQSVAKFRRAIRLRPEFDRACYNLGTVYYAHACSLQNEAQSQVSLHVHCT